MRLAIALGFAMIAGLAFGTTGFAQDEQAPNKNSFGPRVQPSQDSGSGQSGQDQPPPPEVIATHGEWKITCETIPENAAAASGATPGQKQCGMVQTAHNEKQPKIQLTLIVVKEKQNDKVVPMMRVLVPLGVFLPTGIALEVDGAAVGRVPYARCTRVCYAFAAATGDMLDKLRKGSAANFIIYQGPGLGLPMKISLSGFSAAFAALQDPK